MAAVETPLVVITGPTASGKSALALDLAERYGGEIICADSRTIYCGMDIGTAKPTRTERARVPHYLLDVVEPGEKYTAADFQTDAYRAIEAIRKRGKIPFLVGGTGLYIDSVVREYEWPEWTESQVLRSELEALKIDQLQVMLKKQHISLPTNELNKRHLVNALMRGGIQGKARLLPRENVHVVAIATPNEVLQLRIEQRAKSMFESGVVGEAKALAKKYGWESEAMTGNIYPIIRQVLSEELTEPEAIEKITTRDRQLVKRQLTWLRRHDYVQWLSLAGAKTYIETILR